MKHCESLVTSYPYPYPYPYLCPFCPYPCPGLYRARGPCCASAACRGLSLVGRSRRRCGALLDSKVAIWSELASKHRNCR